ncbi:MAG: hypothetical protein LIP01_05190 [Tannerellaceae bacterium]|nr:hypothetical protein [Tannerellaceae bacterium]
MKKQQELIKEIYLEWIIETILKKPSCCQDLPEYTGMNITHIQALYPDMLYYQISAPDEKTELDSEDKQMYIPFTCPGFIGGILTDEKYIIFSFNHEQVVKDAFFIRTQDFESTFSERIFKKIKSLWIQMITEELSYDDTPDIPGRLFLN